MFGCRLPLRSAFPPASTLAACGCRMASAVSNRLTSTNCPLPDFDRSNSASEIAIAAFKPVLTSMMGTPSLVGSASAGPLIVMNPVSAWTAAS
ncbi:Uncharacterised protein [Bordetella pertussis]|nr:Uncharacterised protein [Bordetella pertussis]CFP58517.1 Uncharacterised protein [Bordetella pertussis]CFW33977.1 Uncharacterised protein [Bordetella pertussis]